jgi:2-polyprenyl-3-methyl-5-hydroxy-6-metoxy-1,4-benzoquinol methylase
MTKHGKLDFSLGYTPCQCFLSSNGYDITAMDIQAPMLIKAKKRAETQELPINFVEEDICSIPFETDRFNVILEIYSQPTTLFRQHWSTMKS